VVGVVLARQREYFDHGPQFLRPLPMIEVAEQLGIHVGTVSRAVAGKWLQTPRGAVELRRFFSGGIETRDGEDRSWDAIKAMLREVVEAEDQTEPLSDQAIADRLKERGVDIARRTVVKYREQLGIPAARQRKQHVA
jgi:RNA polymerase sigma-54 factor